MFFRCFCISHWGINCPVDTYANLPSNCIGTEVRYWQRPGRELASREFAGELSVGIWRPKGRDHELAFTATSSC